jgi:hypothetical protein
MKLDFTFLKGPFKMNVKPGNESLSVTIQIKYIQFKVKGKGKAVLLQAWSGPEGCRKLRFPDFMTTTQDGGKVVSLMH